MEVGVIAPMRCHKMINGSKLLIFSSRSWVFGIDDFFRASRLGGSRDPPRRPTQGSGNDGNDDDDDGNGNDDEHPDADHPTCPRAQG